MKKHIRALPKVFALVLVFLSLAIDNSHAKSADYATASIGKWHLGGEEYYPEKQGFDLNLAGTEAPSPKTYFAPYNIATLPEGPPGEYLTDRLGVEAEKYLEEHQDKPFFLY